MPCVWQRSQGSCLPLRQTWCLCAREMLADAFGTGLQRLAQTCVLIIAALPRYAGLWIVRRSSPAVAQECRMVVIVLKRGEGPQIISPYQLFLNKILTFTCYHLHIFLISFLLSCSTDWGIEHLWTTGGAKGIDFRLRTYRRPAVLYRASGFSAKTSPDCKTGCTSDVPLHITCIDRLQVSLSLLGPRLVLPHCLS